jgi:hypothetical protein
MEESDTGWNGHKWRDANPRQLQVGAGTPVLHQHCVQCGRDFLMDLTSRRARAVHKEWATPVNGKYLRS